MEQEKSFFKSTAGIVVIVIAVLCCCCAVLILGGAGSFYYLNSQATAEPWQEPTAIVEIPTIEPTETASPVPTLAVTDVAADTLTTLEDTIVPENDPRDLACRLKGICNVPDTMPSGPFKAGDKQKFWVLNGETIEYRQVDATLVYLTDVAYFWVEDGVRFSQREAENLVDAFSEKMVPTDRDYFGMESNPGIDGDPHIYILYATDIGSSTAGYFYSNASLHPLVDEYSSAHEMFVFNADNSPLSDEYTYSIADGDATPSLADHSDFGSALVSDGTVTRTFTIRNTGTAALTLNGTPKVAVGGAQAAEFTVALQPGSPVAAATGTTTFQVTFDPAAAGVRSATLSIASNDTDENPYNFSIQGTGTQAPPASITIQTPQALSNDRMVIRWNSAGSEFYTVYHSTNLLTEFSVLRSHLPATPPVNSYTDSVNSVMVKFWKVSQE